MSSISLGPYKDKDKVKTMKYRSKFYTNVKAKYQNYHHQICEASEGKGIMVLISISHWYLSFYTTAVFFMLHKAFNLIIKQVVISKDSMLQGFSITYIRLICAFFLNFLVLSNQLLCHFEPFGLVSFSLGVHHKESLHLDGLLVCNIPDH